MTADWKKKPLERGKRYSDIQRLQARVKELEASLELNNAQRKSDQIRLAEVTRIARERLESSNRYAELRRYGVMIEDEGQFKFLKGEDLDEFMKGFRLAQPFFTFDEIATVGWQAFSKHRIFNGTLSGHVKVDGTWYRFHAEP